jgi:outer membrane protein TolC
LSNFPTFVELAARDTEANALMRRGRTWLAGQPTLSFRYQSDRSLDSTGLREYEMGMELPLWRPGQRADARAVGTAAGAESDAAALALRHDVIGFLRTAVWAIERAARVKAVADDGVGVAEDLLRVVQRRYDAGELPMTDVLLARNTLMQRQAIVIEAEAALLDAERSYRSLTGLDNRPAVFAETLSTLEDPAMTHPALQLADAEVARARAELALTDASGRGTPTLTIGPRREQAAFSTFQTDSLGISVAVPFGGRPQRAVQTAAASRRVASTEAARAQLLRQIDLSLHEARHMLVVIDASLDLTRQRAALAATHLQMSETAFAQGEMTLFELLQQQETAQLTQHEIARLQVEREYAITQINQALGEWP